MAVFRDELLRPSETFVRDQGEALERYRACYAGSRRVAPGLALPADRAFVLNPGTRLGRAEEIAFKLAGVAPRLERWIRGRRARLVHAHFGVDGLLVLPVARRLGLPLVVTFHGYDATVTGTHGGVENYPHARYLRSRARLARGGSRFIAVSRFVRARLLEVGFPEERVVVHYVGVDIERFRPSPGTARLPVVLFVGRLAPNKGCDHLITAMRRVHADHPEAELVVIGDGPERARLERLAAGLRCRFLGIQPHDVVRDWMGRARVFCVPSITVPSGASEGFGLVQLEAQAMGTPVASYRTGGIPEAVEDGVTGWLVDEGDRDALANRIARLLSDREAWAALSRAARERVVQGFDLRTQTRQLETLYDQVLAESRPAGR